MVSQIKNSVTNIEIKQQPELWIETLGIIEENSEKIKEFLKKFNPKETRVIFTGAGTSEFVGNSIVDAINKDSKFRIESTATTDIVSNPDLYLNKEETTIIVSCARSGNSPESVATVELADQLLDDIHHIFLTCNPEGKLAKYAKGKSNVLSLLMPAKSNDKGFAMTGSYTCMSLSGILLFNLDKMSKIRLYIEEISKAVVVNSPKIEEFLKVLSEKETDRIVCLGDGTLKGVAQEGSLKILELSSGYMSTNFDTFLGFRHGPKSIVTDDTLIICFMSNDEHTRKYELDLLKEFKNEKTKKTVLVIDNKFDKVADENSDYYYSYNNNGMAQMPDVYSLFGYIYVDQLYAFMKSVNLEINPDNPCPTGEVNRVVQGVILHKLEK